jgi:DNA-binding transcriptional LysR family regulator
MSALNPRQIEAFRAVMLSGSATAAASLLAITQPAVSRLLRDLQYTTGLKLFDRRGGRLVPTGEALSLYAEVERSFVGLDRIALAARDLRARRAGTLRIAALPALANGFLPRFVGRFLQGRPKLDLALFGLVSHSVLDWVVGGQCEIGFAETRIEHPGVATEPMPPVTCVAVLPRGHRLARRRRLRPADLAGEAFVSLGQSSLTRFRVDKVFAEHDIKRETRVETHLSEIACALVAAGVGVSICDPLTANEYAPRGLDIRPFEPRIEFEFAAVYATMRPPSAIAREFIDAFRAHVASFNAAQA